MIFFLFVYVTEISFYNSFSPRSTLLSIKSIHYYLKLFVFLGTHYIALHVNVYLIQLKGTVHLKMNICSKCTYPQAIQD